LFAEALVDEFELFELLNKSDREITVYPLLLTLFDDVFELLFIYV
jgi:hypothetical protein